MARFRDALVISAAMVAALPRVAHALYQAGQGGDEAVAALVFGPVDTFGSGYCTGVLVGHRTVLTSATCARQVQSATVPAQAVFGDNVFDGTGIAVTGVRVHRRFDGTSSYDLGVVYLAADAPVAPAALNASDPGQFLAPLSSTVEIIGFGGTGVGGTAGYRNFSDQQLTGYAGRMMRILVWRYDTASRSWFQQGGLCPGDGGAPIFGDVGGTKVVSIAGASEGGRCGGDFFGIRVDVFVDDFINPAIDAYEGPCQADGACVTVGCRTPDPDCMPDNVCGAQGICDPMCAAPDWDCPIVGQLGDECTSRYGCESRICLPTGDQPGLSLCSDACGRDPTTLCPHGMTCQMIAGQAICRFDAPSPRAQGHDCLEDDECHSGMCDYVVHTCVEACDAASPCTGELVCRASSFGRDVCLPKLEAAGICQVSTAAGSADGGALPWLLVGGVGLAGVLVVPRVRRRRASRA